MKLKKADKTTKADKPAKKKPVPPEMPKADYGVDYIAKACGITPFTVRMKLRDAGIKKDGRIYDFKKSDAEKVIKMFKAGPKPGRPAKEAA